MFDTMTITKIGAAFFGALLAFLLANWASDGLYAVGGYHDEEHAAGYSIDTGEEEGAVEEEVVEVAFADVYAAADAAAGERLWRQCQACHALDGSDGVGPHLNGVVGRQIAAVDGYGYSGALAGMSDMAWTPENISGFIAAPRDWAPGTAMGYSGMRDIEDRANLIAYLETQQ